MRIVRGGAVAMTALTTGIVWTACTAGFPGIFFHGSGRLILIDSIN
jgi:hypothetical protein